MVLDANGYYTSYKSSTGVTYSNIVYETVGGTISGEVQIKRITSYTESTATSTNNVVITYLDNSTDLGSINTIVVTPV